MRLDRDDSPIGRLIRDAEIVAQNPRSLEDPEIARRAVEDLLQVGNEVTGGIEGKGAEVKLGEATLILKSGRRITIKNGKEEKRDDLTLTVFPGGDKSETRRTVYETIIPGANTPNFGFKQGRFDEAAHEVKIVEDPKVYSVVAEAARAMRALQGIANVNK